MKIIVGYHGTQEDVITLTPQQESGVEFITVQLQDDNGRPLTDVHFIPVPGIVGDLYLMPLLVAGMRESLPKLIAFFQKAVRFVNVNGGVFNEAAFIDSVHAGLHKPAPLPSPITPQPVPVVVGPAPNGTLTVSVAQVTIETYAKQRSIGSAMAGVFAMPQVVGGGYGRNYSGGQESKGICIIVCSLLNSKPAAFLVRNDFFLNYTGPNWDRRTLLGAPIEDEHSVADGAEQRFQKGRMFWRSSTGKVEVYNLKGDRIN